MRIIVTHTEGKTPTELASIKEVISNHSGIPTEFIITVARDTSGNAIEELLSTTTLDDPIQVRLGDGNIDKLVGMSTLLHVVREEIEKALEKIQVAHEKASTWQEGKKSSERDIEILNLQQGIAEAIRKDTIDIMEKAQELESSQRSICYARVNTTLVVALETFISFTNSYLTWDASDPNDLRNRFRCCNYCGEVYELAEGCHGFTTCGSVPTSGATASSPDDRTRENAVQKAFFDALKLGARHFLPMIFGSKSSSSIGCGQVVSFRSMLPPTPEQIEQLQDIPIDFQGERNMLAVEGAHRADLRLHEQRNTDKLDEDLNRSSLD